MTRYASQTTVSPGRSREEIERVLTRYGASGFLSGYQGTRAFLAFLVAGRRVRDHALPAIEQAYKSGKAPLALLPEVT
jgi:primosomal protein N'